MYKKSPKMKVLEEAYETFVCFYLLVYVVIYF